METEIRTCRIGQSADPDDAFMAWGLATGRTDVDGFDTEVVFSDIETLNEWALEGRLELTALSAGAYPRVAHRYRLLRSGASFGRDYGPLVVAPAPAPGAAGPTGPGAIRGRRVAIPGRLTTAFLLLRIHAGDDFESVAMPFDRILDAVLEGDVDAGLIIHEGQLTYRELGLYAVVEPARAWHQRTRLPVPLGVVAVRRDLGDEGCRALSGAFRRSIDAARSHPVEALAFAADHGRGLDEETLRTFVDQYVDATTLDMGAEGRDALETLYAAARRAGLLDGVPPLDLL